jgi:hypothetical protein
MGMFSSIYMVWSNDGYVLPDISGVKQQCVFTVSYIWCGTALDMYSLVAMVWNSDVYVEPRSYGMEQ